VSDADYWLPLQDVHVEIQRVMTLTRNEWAPKGVPRNTVTPAGAQLWVWPDGSWLDYGFGVLEGGGDGFRVRVRERGCAIREYGWLRSPWCAMADGDQLTFMGERVKGAPRPELGTLTWAEARETPCGLHAGTKLSECLCLPQDLEQRLGELPDVVVSEPVELPPLNRGQFWEVECEKCGKAEETWASEGPPFAVCCNQPVQLRQWPQLMPTERAASIMAELDERLRKARKGAELAACQACNKPISPGQHYRATAKNSRRRRLHALCVEALGR